MDAKTLERLEGIEEITRAGQEWLLDDTDTYQWLCSTVREQAQRIAELETVTHLDIGHGNMCNMAGEAVDDIDKTTCRGCLRSYAKGQLAWAQAWEDAANIDALPPADAALLASANRVLVEKVERLERVLRDVLDSSQEDHWTNNGHILAAADAALRGNP